MQFKYAEKYRHILQLLFNYPKVASGWWEGLTSTYAKFLFPSLFLSIFSLIEIACLPLPSKVYKKLISQHCKPTFGTKE